MPVCCRCLHQKIQPCGWNVRFINNAPRIQTGAASRQSMQHFPWATSKQLREASTKTDRWLRWQRVIQGLVAPPWLACSASSCFRCWVRARNECPWRRCWWREIAASPTGNYGPCVERRVMPSSECVTRPKCSRCCVWPPTRLPSIAVVQFASSISHQVGT